MQTRRGELAGAVRTAVVGAIALAALLGAAQGCATGAAPPTASAATTAHPSRASVAEVADPPQATESLASSRFFHTGNGALSLENGHTGEKLHVRYRDAHGAYDAAALGQIDAFFRSRGDDQETRVSLRLIEMIASLQASEHPSEIVLMSGYRSGEYNASIIARGGNAAKASMHTEGLAADLVFAGLDQHALWLKVRELECCGAGYYASGNFLHLDVGRPRFWEESTSRVKENLSKGNARVFARTDFDRYASLDGAVIGVHSVTLRPLKIARTAEFVPDGDAGASGMRTLYLSSDAAARGGGSCLDFPAGETEPPIKLAVADGRGAQGVPQRGHIVLRTCDPRLEATPETIETNPIEIGVPLSPPASGARGRA